MAQRPPSAWHAPDPFGLDRDLRIRASGVRDVFTPHRPIQSVEFFFGREKLVRKLIEQINTPGQHALLYGDRGVGKSSLANIASTLLLQSQTKGELFQKRCDRSDSFASILDEPLRKYGFFGEPAKTVVTKTEGGQAGLKLPLASAGVETTTEKSREYVGRSPAIAPSTVAAMLKNKRGLLLIDEADAIGRKHDRQRLAELIKHLSDDGSLFKVLIVGIAQTGEELTGAHPSVQRCLKETMLDRMTDSELAKIIIQGSKKTRIAFEDEVTEKIVELSAGYPHFTHLLALKCAEYAIGERLDRVSKDCLINGMDLAVSDAEGSLRRSYEEAVRSANTDMYRVVLVAASMINGSEFSAAELRSAIRSVNSETIEQRSLNNYLNRLCASDTSCVLQRISKGMYRFSDPRMPSFVKIKNHVID